MSCPLTCRARHGFLGSARKSSPPQGLGTQVIRSRRGRRCHAPPALPSSQEPRPNHDMYPRLPLSFSAYAGKSYAKNQNQAGFLAGNALVGIGVIMTGPGFLPLTTPPIQMGVTDSIDLQVIHGTPSGNGLMAPKISNLQTFQIRQVRVPVAARRELANLKAPRPDRELAHASQPPHSTTSPLPARPAARGRRWARSPARCRPSGVQGEGRPARGSSLPPRCKGCAGGAPSPVRGRGMADDGG